MRLLLVEDNEELSKLLVKSLGASGFDADAVTTAADALSVLGSTHYAAVILDLGLPDADGSTVLRTLRSRQNAVPVLILTARDGVNDRVAGLRAGADDYLVKPFAVEELVAEIGAAFLCADLKLTPEVREDHAAYIASWLKALKDDKKVVFVAASHAQRATDFLHGLQPKPERDPEPPGQVRERDPSPGLPVNALQ